MCGVQAVQDKGIDEAFWPVFELEDVKEGKGRSHWLTRVALAAALAASVWALHVYAPDRTRLKGKLKFGQVLMCLAPCCTLPLEAPGCIVLLRPSMLISRQPTAERSAMRPASCQMESNIHMLVKPATTCDAGRRQARCAAGTTRSWRCSTCTTAPWSAWAPARTAGPTRARPEALRGEAPGHQRGAPRGARTAPARVRGARRQPRRRAGHRRRHPGLLTSCRRALHENRTRSLVEQC